MQRAWVTSSSYEMAVALLIETRSTAALSQRDLADRLGKPRSFVSKVETRERRLDFVEFVAYARALGLDPADLMMMVAQRVGPDVVF
ncbi:helix-turn-helix domain-containing protein [Brevundimonas sp. VNH65]|uniref:helix-turn-helix domain-containing protein n=1 Tax=Brevundimonas sp. VNH65 TaxID=3400917 RepID=UPI003C0794E7